MYLTFIGSVITYASETWTINEQDEKGAQCIWKADLKKDIWPTTNRRKYLENTK